VKFQKISVRSHPAPGRLATCFAGGRWLSSTIMKLKDVDFKVYGRPAR